MLSSKNMIDTTADSNEIGGACVFAGIWNGTSVSTKGGSLGNSIGNLTARSGTFSVERGRLQCKGFLKA